MVEDRRDGGRPPLPVWFSYGPPMVGVVLPNMEIGKFSENSLKIHRIFRLSKKGKLGDSDEF